jgi:hypothetical protein
LVLYTDKVQYANINYTVPTNTYPHYSKALNSKIDWKKLSLYFAFRPNEVIQHTLRQTTQLAKSIIHHPMQRHLNSWIQILRGKRLNEVFATDAYFLEKSIEGYFCAQVFFCMTSKILHVAEMKTDSVSTDV